MDLQIDSVQNDGKNPKKTQKRSRERKKVKNSCDLQVDEVESRRTPSPSTFLSML